MSIQIQTTSPDLVAAISAQTAAITANTAALEKLAGAIAGKPPVAQSATLNAVAKSAEEPKVP